MNATLVRYEDIHAGDYVLHQRKAKVVDARHRSEDGRIRLSLRGVASAPTGEHDGPDDAVIEGPADTEVWLAARWPRTPERRVP